MDFSKLTPNEKLAIYGSVAVFLAGILSNWGGLFWLAVLAGVAMAAMILLPQLADTTSRLGSRGTLMATLGLVAAAAGVIELLRFLEYFLGSLGRFTTIAFIVALVGAALMAYAGWRELQREGGTWRFGAEAAPGTASDATAPAAPIDAAPTAASEPMDPEESRTEA